MPKTNQGGATAAGMTGIVLHGAPLADGRVLSELDPERNLDGSLIDGEHPDREGDEKRSEVQGPTDLETLQELHDRQAVGEDEEPDEDEKPEQTDRSAGHTVKSDTPGVRIEQPAKSTTATKSTTAAKQK